MTVQKKYDRKEKRRNEPVSEQVVPKSWERTNTGTRRRNATFKIKAFEEKDNRKTEERMRNNPYKDLPPLECRPDDSLYRMNPAQLESELQNIQRLVDRIPPEVLA